MPRPAAARRDEGEYRQYLTEDKVVGHGAKGCVAVLAVFRHRSNLVRLQAGFEHRLGEGI